MGKKLYLSILLTFLVVCQSLLLVSAKESQEGYVWRIDTQNESHLPRNFRTTNTPFKPTKGTVPSTVGLAELHESGSAQFSKLEFEVMLPKLKEASTGPIYIVDLRQESHGFLNGIGVSWYGNHNWANVGKTFAEVEKDENRRIKDTLNKVVTISVLDDNKNASDSQEITVNSALSESEFVTSQGVKYFRITATDHSWPQAENIDKFIEFYKKLPKNAWLHFHCQAGEGRTTSYMTMYDMMRNGKKVSFEDIVKRQRLIGGQNLLKTTAAKEKDSWKNELFEEKVKFIHKFYEYVTQTPDDFPISWSEWLKQHQN